MKYSLIFILTFSTIEGYCCECFTNDLEMLLKHADYAFVGEAVNNVSPDSVLSDSLDRRGFGSTVEFRVIQVVKGEISNKDIVIDQRGNGSCTVSFQFGTQYLVFGSKTMLLPSTSEQRTSEYLLDKTFSDASEQEIGTMIEKYDNFFSSSKSRTYIYADKCRVYSSSSKQFKRIKKYIR